MASGTVKKATKPFEVDTGISGVTAWKSGNMVTLFIASQVTNTTAGWKTLGTLPASLKPAAQIIFCGYNNSTNSYSTNVVQDCMLGMNGLLSAYLFSSNLSIELRATVTYPTSN